MVRVSTARHETSTRKTSVAAPTCLSEHKIISGTSFLAREESENSNDLAEAISILLPATSRTEAAGTVALASRRPATI
jgi:hypothetical protein